MQTKIVPTACRKVIENGNYHYIIKAVAMTNDGKQFEFAIKTRQNSKTPESIKIRVGEKQWQETRQYPADLLGKVADFLNLLAPCFGNKLPRNKLFLNKPRLLMDMTPKADRPACSTLMTNYLCLINSEFLHVGRERTLYGYKTIYSTRPVDMSEDWKVVNVSLETESLITAALSQYKSRLSRYALVEYRKDMVNRGAWMS